MKNNILKFLLSLVILTSCSDDFYEGLNQDPNRPEVVSSENLFNHASKSLFDQMTSTNVNTNVFRLYSQYWTQTTYIDESNYDMVTRGIPANHWNEIYRNVLFDLKDAKSKVDTETKPGNITASEWTNIQNNKKAVISILEVYAWQQLVDTFGNIPYSQALQVDVYKTPKYDDAETIYKDLFVRINDAINKITTTSDGYEDSYYNGNMTSWKKAGNSLKLRMAMRVADVPSLSTLSKQMAESAFTSGVFMSNSDNLTIKYEGSPPNTNPIWVDLVQSNRNDFVAANTIVDEMNTLMDPRRPQYFRQNLGANVYDGGIYGASNDYFNYTQIGDKIHQPIFPASLIDNAEVQFHLAHAAAMNYSVGGTAAAYYNAAITASMQEWGVTNADITAYLANANVNYSTAPGTWREKIGRQFWLAMYNRGFEGWTVWRQFDAPSLNVADDSGETAPFRYTYPIPEQNLNQSNYNSASTAIGGDDMYTKLFWDKF